MGLGLGLGFGVGIGFRFGFSILGEIPIRDTDSVKVRVLRAKEL